MEHLYAQNVKMAVAVGFAFLLFLKVSFSQIVVGDESQMNVGKETHLYIEADVDIEAGGVLDLSGKMNVDGDFTNSNNDGFLIRSNSNTQGSLLHSTDHVAVTADCYIPAYTGASGWHFLSSPTIDQAIRPEFVSNENPIPGNDDFYSFDEATYTWVNTRNASGNWNVNFESDFVEGKGYLVAYQEAVTKQFSGELNRGDFVFDASSTPALTYTEGKGSQNGWNLLGNPYPSAIDYDLCSRSNVEDAVYVYDGEAGQYVSWVDGVGALEDGVIPVMNGFFVKTMTSDASLTIPNSSRLHTSVGYYKTADVVSDLLVLKVEGNNLEDKTYVRFKSDATTAYDVDYDARKIMGVEEAPQLFTSDGYAMMSVNSMPYSTEEIIIPLSLRVGEESDYFISVQQESFYHTVSIELKDQETGTLYDLWEGRTLRFSHSPELSTERFLLIFNGATSIEESENESLLDVWATDQQIYINKNRKESFLYQVVNVLGQTIASGELKELDSQVIIPVDEKGMYLVNVFNRFSKETVQVMVR